MSSRKWPLEENVEEEDQEDAGPSPPTAPRLALEYGPHEFSRNHVLRNTAFQMLRVHV